MLVAIGTGLEGMLPIEAVNQVNGSNPIRLFKRALQLETCSAKHAPETLATAIVFLSFSLAVRLRMCGSE